MSEGVEREKQLQCRLTEVEKELREALECVQTVDGDKNEVLAKLKVNTHHSVHVYVYGWMMGEWVGGRMDGWTDRQMDRWISCVELCNNTSYIAQFVFLWRNNKIELFII